MKKSWSYLLSYHFNPDIKTEDNLQLKSNLLFPDRDLTHNPEDLLGCYSLKGEIGQPEFIAIVSSVKV